MGKALRVGHGPIDEDVLDNLTKQEKAWLKSWNRGSEIPGEEGYVDPEDLDEDDTDEDESEDYNDLSVDRLKELLKERDLPVSGNKDELVARLEEDDEDDDEE